MVVPGVGVGGDDDVAVPDVRGEAGVPDVEGHAGVMLVGGDTQSRP